MRWNKTARRFVVLVFLLAAGSVGAADPEQTARDERTLREASIDSDGPALLDFFRKRTADDVDPDKIKELVRKLGDDSFQMREKASGQLVALGRKAVPLLKQALKDSDVEVVRRAEECLRRIGDGSPAAQVDAAARLLALRKPAGAAETLLAFLPFADDEITAEAVRAALAALAIRDGKPEPALVAALGDKTADRRTAAAVALCRSGLPEPRPALEKLLEDADTVVRLRVALALAEAGEKTAIPVLIDLQGELSQAQLWSAQNLLYRLAGDKAPTLVRGTDADGRAKYRDAWAAWWREHGAKTDLAALHQPSKPLGYTLVVLLDIGRIMELDADNKPRWQLDAIAFPLDAQFLPGDRVLMAEQQGNRVAERDLKGKVVWEKQVGDPLVAQRLPNGNTFIATRTQLLEVNRDGKEVFTYSRPGGELIMRASRLPNGDIALVTSSADGNLASRYVRLDPTGATELQSFPVEVRTYGGRIEVLPNGRVLVPQKDSNRVVEHDARGKIVWEVASEQPIAAVRLANGNTLVTSMTQQRAVELDPKGKEIWQYRADTRVTRAWRR